MAAQRPNLHDRITWEVFQNTSIGITDYSNLEGEALIELMKLSQSLIINEPPKSVLLLEKAPRIKMDEDSLRYLADYISATKPFVRKIAVTGGPTGVLAERFTSKEYPIQYFPSIEEAVQFLLQ